MGAETSKAIPRRLRDPAFHQKYFVGTGIDVGAGGDPLSRYVPLFPRLTGVFTFDVVGSDADFTGDGTTLAGVVDNAFDFVHSSHCLEHIADPVTALTNWLRVTQPGGHVIVLIPEWTMYEHRVWPSQFNMDHKHAFYGGVSDPSPWANELPIGNVVALLQALPLKCAELVKYERLESTYLDLVITDQTIGIGECAIEFVLRKL